MRHRPLAETLHRVVEHTQRLLVGFGDCLERRLRWDFLDYMPDIWQKWGCDI